MVAHVVMFDLRPDLTAGERQEFANGFTRALESVPGVGRVRVGQRTSIGASYETPAGFDFVAVLEFDDEAGLRHYLEHPAHAELGALFWACTARTLVADFTLAGNDLPLALAKWSSAV